MSKNFRETLDKQLENPEFKAEYEALEVEYHFGKHPPPAGGTLFAKEGKDKHPLCERAKEGEYSSHPLGKKAIICFHITEN